MRLTNFDHEKTDFKPFQRFYIGMKGLKQDSSNQLLIISNLTPAFYNGDSDVGDIVMLETL